MLRNYHAPKLDDWLADLHQHHFYYSSRNYS